YYIHGHSVGGTNPTLIEAVSLKKPIIAFKTSFNKEILNNNAIYFKNEKELNSILNFKIYIGLKNPEFKYSYTSEYINNGYSRLILD
ncbi:MAG: glycosyl transferase, partial [Alphaproteobacteria bacterium]